VVDLRKSLFCCGYFSSYVRAFPSSSCVYRNTCSRWSLMGQFFLPQVEDLDRMCFPPHALTLSIFRIAAPPWNMSSWRLGIDPFLNSLCESPIFPRRDFRFPFSRGILDASPFPYGLFSPLHHLTTMILLCTRTGLHFFFPLNPLRPWGFPFFPHPACNGFLLSFFSSPLPRRTSSCLQGS